MSEGTAVISRIGRICHSFAGSEQVTTAPSYLILLHRILVVPKSVRT
jgi:hypothetical protein